MVQNGLLPEEILSRLDMDRIKEEEEDFLTTDRRKALALDRRQLKPLKDRHHDGQLLGRSIVGE